MLLGPLAVPATLSPLVVNHKQFWCDFGPASPHSHALMARLGRGMAHADHEANASRFACGWAKAMPHAACYPRVPLGAEARLSC